MEAPENADTAAAASSATDKSFTIYDVQACLYDVRRVNYLSDAIYRTVKPGDVVVDAGSGTGVLGLLAAKAGARRVYCIELSPQFVPVIQENARRNGLEGKIIAVNADATTFELPEQADVLISEVISGGFFYEPQLQILNNLCRFLKPEGMTIPLTMTNSVELIEAQENLYGLVFNYETRFAELDGDRSLTSSTVYLQTSFGEFNDPAIEATVRVRARHTGVANAVKIAYEILFAEGIKAHRPTDFLLNPQIIFLPEATPLEAGHDYDISLTYKASESPMDCKIVVEPPSQP